MTLKKTVPAAALAAAITLLAGCGSNSTATTAGTGPGGQTGGTGGNTPTIQGVATPESVAVVTATNAN
jgi:hypothetical protein